MSSFDLPEIGGLKDIKDVRNYLHQYKRTLDYLLEGKLSTKNIMEVGGWFADENLLMSEDGDVGFSTDDSLANNLRMWAGSPNVAKETAPFRVYQNGALIASVGYIGGWQILGDRLVSNTGLAELRSDGSIFGVRITGSTLATTPGLQQVVIDTGGVSIKDPSGMTRLALAVSDGPFYSLKFYGSGALDAFMYSNFGALNIRSSGDINMSGFTKIIGSVSFTSATVYGLAITDVDGLLGSIQGLQNQINALSLSISGKSSIGHTHSVTTSNHNHGNPNNAPGTGGGTYTTSGATF